MSVITAIIHGGRSLLTHCRFPDGTGYSSGSECPFDPTRIYVSASVLVCVQLEVVFGDLAPALGANVLTPPPLLQSTTLILWVPLIVTCVVQAALSARCSAACATFLGLPCCPSRKRSQRLTAVGSLLAYADPAWSAFLKGNSLVL